MLTKIGRNAVAHAYFTAGEIDGDKRQVSAEIGEFDRAEFLEKWEGRHIRMTDGRSLRFEGGHLVGDNPDAVLIRSTNAAGIFIALPDAAEPVPVA